MLLDLMALDVTRIVVTVNLAVIQLSATPAGPIDIDYGPRDVDSITSIVPETIRPFSPAVLGDNDKGTSFIVDPVAGPDIGSLIVNVTEMNNAPESSVGEITKVVFWCIGAMTDGSPALVTSAFLKWKVGAVEGGAEITAFPAGDLTPQTHGQRTSGEITTQPNGNPWTWAAINDLHDVKVQMNYNIPGGQLLGMVVSEIWLEAYGKGGVVIGGATERRKVRFVLAEGLARQQLYVGMPQFRVGPAIRQQIGLTVGVPRVVLSIGVGPIEVEM